MPDTALDQLIHACLDGRATTDELARLEAALTADAAARDRYLCLSDLHACLAIDEGLWQEPTAAHHRQPSGPAPAPPAGGSLTRPAAAAAIGLLVGLCSAGLAFGYVMPVLSRPLQVFADGFESGPAPECRGLVARPGIWSGDTAEVLAADQGVLPAEGQQMLRVLRADYPGKSATDSYISDTYRLIDLGPFQQPLATGQAIARLRARFNAAAFPADEGYTAGVTVMAFDATTAARLETIPDAELAEQALAMTQRRSVAIDRQPASWQPIDCELRLPPQSRFLLLRISISHQHAAQRRPSFSGHYLDDVAITLEQSPAAVQP